MVAEQGIEPIVETDGTRAAMRVAGERFDLMAVEINLPGVGGLGLLTQSNGADPSVPVIGSTGHARFDVAITAVEGRAEGFLVLLLHRQVGHEVIIGP